MEIMFAGLANTLWIAGGGVLVVAVSIFAYRVCSYILLPEATSSCESALPAGTVAQLPVSKFDLSREVPPFDAIKNRISQIEDADNTAPYVQPMKVAIKSISEKGNILENDIAMHFEKGSLTYRRYADALDSALKAARGNAAAYSNRVTDFCRESQRADANMQARERVEIYEMVKGEEELLATLDDMGRELSSMEGDASCEKLKVACKELSKLTEQLSLYGARETV